MPRFAILAHDHPFAHWDFFLEAGDSLRSWRLTDEPRPGATVRAEAIADHRLLYLDYEGPVSGDRGRVQRYDAGIFTGDLAGTRLRVILEGQHLHGRVTLDWESGAWWRVAFAASEPESSLAR